MQFPKGKKERLQIYALIGVFIVGGIWGIIFMVFLPMTDSLKKARREIVELQDKLDRTGKEIAKIQGAKERNEVLKTELRAIDERYMLKAEYGNYLLRAREYIEKAAVGADVKVGGISPVGEVSIPNKHGSKLRAFIMGVTVKCGYEDLMDLLARLEGGNPHLSVSGVTIGVDPADNTRQNAGFNVSFPMWENPLIVSNFVAVQEEEHGDAATNAPSAGAVVPKGRGEREGALE